MFVHVLVAVRVRVRDQLANRGNEDAHAHGDEQEYVHEYVYEYMG